MHAWGNDGHKVVCAIAYKLLDRRQRAEVDRLVELYRTPDGWTHDDYTSSCTFPDLARRKARDGERGWERFARFSDWHFLNVPRSTVAITVEVAREWCDDDCVLRGIDEHAAQLGDARRADAQRAEALMFLSHWIGDLHQPLHISYKDDAGGNRLEPISGSYYASAHLHAVWDSGILRKARGPRDFWTWAGALEGQVTPDQRSTWEASGPVDWAAESYSITTANAVKYCRWRSGECRRARPPHTLTSRYQREFGAVVEKRLQQAGVRLAMVIRKSLTGEQ